MEVMGKLKKIDNWLTKALKNTFMVVGILATIYWTLELVLKLLGK